MSTQAKQRDPGRLGVEILIVLAIVFVPDVVMKVASNGLPPAVVQFLSVSILPFAALACILLLRRDGIGLTGLGLARPASWFRTVGTGVLVGAGLLLVSVVAISPLVVAVFGSYLDPAMFDPLVGDARALATNILISFFHAALCEEIIFRGFLLQQFERLLDAGTKMTIAAILIQAALFGLAHYPQGGAGILATTLGGILWGIAFLAARRNLWVVIIGHAIFDTTVFVLIYLGQHRLLLP